jgi:hypothetical protein
VAWEQVCKPKSMGGLGIHNLKFLNTNLRMRWRWLERNGHVRSWTVLQFVLSMEAESMFKAACKCSVGNDRKTKFWTDCWVNGQSPDQITPDLLALVRSRGAKNVWNRATQNKKFLTLKPRSSLQGGGNGSRTSLIELAEEFVDDEVDVVTSRFPQLTLVSREKMYYPSLAPTI